MNMITKENVLNIIEFTGKQDMIDKFKKDIESSTTIVDFNKIYPVPDELFKYDENRINSFCLFEFKSVLSRYVKLGILALMQDDTTNKNPLSVFSSIREKYSNKEKELENRPIYRFFFHHILFKVYSLFLKRFDKGINKDDNINNIDKFIEFIRFKLSNEERIEVDKSILSKYGLYDKDYYVAVGIFLLILIEKYYVLTDKEFKVLYWGCSSNSINPYWVDNTLIFNTNNRPSPIFKRICKKYSNLDIKIYSIFLNKENNKIEDGECDIRIIENYKGETKLHTILADEPENKEVVKYLNDILSRK